MPTLTELHPGDVLIVRCQDVPSHATVAAVRDLLPDVRFVFLPPGTTISKLDLTDLISHG